MKDDKKGAIILAAGQGKRMVSDLAKVLHPVAGRPLLLHVIDMVKPFQLDKVVVVVGHQADQVKAIFSDQDVSSVVQASPLGTGHAVLQAKEAFENWSGDILILNGDTPALRIETLRRLWDAHLTSPAPITFLSTTMPNPFGYGRLIRNPEGTLCRIVEEKDATSVERAICEINTGVYIVTSRFLFEALLKVKNDNAQREYYLTDLIAIALVEGHPVASVKIDPEEVIGINSRADLAKVEALLRRRINEEWMAKGVTLIDPARIYIDTSVQIGKDCILHPDLFLEGNTQIGDRAILHSVRIKNSRLGADVTILDYCVVEGAEIEAGVTVGPFAHLRPGTILRKGARIGNFVETKKSEIGAGSKANHLSYLGDAVIGERVNMGAGTITCNYDGENKHQTIIENDVFIGSGTQLIAPVHVRSGATIAAGSSITDDVPSDTLAIARSRQKNIPGWRKKKKK